MQHKEGRPFFSSYIPLGLAAGRVASHPCKKGKDGARSVGMVHAKIIKGKPPPNAQAGWDKH